MVLFRVAEHPSGRVDHRQAGLGAASKITTEGLEAGEGLRGRFPCAHAVRDLEGRHARERRQIALTLCDIEICECAAGVADQAGKTDRGRNQVPRQKVPQETLAGHSGHASRKR